MDNAQIGVLIGGVAAIIGVLWFFFGAREEKTGAHTASGPIYACPMHSWITSDDAAANCSICGMKLVAQNDDSREKSARQNG